MFLLAALPLSLAACGGASDNAKAPVAPAGYSDVQKQVIALDKPQLHIVFIRAILDAQQTCQGVTESARGADVKGDPLWIARCSGGARFQISIGPDGTARVTGPLSNPPAG